MLPAYLAHILEHETFTVRSQGWRLLEKFLEGPFRIVRPEGYLQEAARDVIRRRFNPRRLMERQMWGRMKAC